jgi:hypothetical protein
MRVTPENLPCVYKAFDLIMRDNGGINRVEPEREYYEVPEEWTPQLSNIDAALSTLDKDEFMLFCTGDYDLVLSFTADHPSFNLVNEFLDAFFNDWERHGAKT